MKKLLFLLALITLGNFAFSQTIAQQSFEASGDTWTPISLSVPACTSGSDIWDYSTSLSSITPNDGSQFWGIQDLDGDCGGTSFETITMPNVDISSCTSVSFSFDFYTIDYDGGDDIKYELFYDNVSQGEVVVVDGGTSNSSTSGWITETVSVPGTVSLVSVIISVKQNGASDYAGLDNILLTGGCVSCSGPVAEPTNEATALATSNISCTTADLSWTLGADATNSLVVISTSAITGAPVDGTNYTANAVYGSGDILNAGEFIIYNGTGNTVSIAGLTAGTNYFITIFEYNGTVTNCEENYLTGGASTSFTTLTGCVSNDPYITSILYNSCNGIFEGVDEIVMFETGTDPLAFDDITIYYPNETFCNTCSGVSGTIDGGNLNNPTYVNDLNTAAGCTVFAYADPIPPNSTVMIFTGNPPTTVLDYSSQCGASNLPVYVIFNDNSSNTGRFSNSDVRDLTIDFGNGTSQTVTYDGGELAGDGATALYDENGNVSYFSSNNCVYPLPITLGDFYLKTFSDYTSIYWTTLSETNCDYFEVQKSTDGINFVTIGEVTGAGNSSTLINYSFRDESQNTGTVYYRLKQVDFDGKFQYSYTISTSSDLSSIYYAQNQIYLNLDEAKPNHNYVVNIYNLNGQLITSSFTNGKNALSFSQKGLFFVEIPELQIHRKVVCY